MARIPKEEVDALKEAIDLVSLVRSHGVSLKKQGRNWVGVCPFHEDGEASLVVNPQVNLWRCFGCDESGGDAFSFLMKKEGIDFREAYERLRGISAATPAPRKKRAKPGDGQKKDPQAKARRRALLGRVAEYYRQRFSMDPRARKYLAERGIGDDEPLEAFAVGYCDGSLRDNLPADDQVIEDLEALGILQKRGELLAECAVFPLWDMKGQCVGMYGRRLYDSAVNHLYLPGRRRGLVNWRAVERGSRIVLCESVIDALSLAQAGIDGALPCYGTQGFIQDHLSFLNRQPEKEAVICFDGDDAGRRAAAALEERLRERGAVRIVELPEGSDLSQLLVEQGPARLRELLEPPRGKSVAAAPSKAREGRAERPAAPIPPDEPGDDAGDVPGNVGQLVEKTSHGLILRRVGRRYEVKGLARQGTQLRVTVKASLEGGDGRFELSTIDLYSGRSRQWFAGEVSRCFEVSEGDIRADLNALIEAVEGLKEAPAEEETSRVEISDKEREEALGLLESPRLLEDILSDYETMGFAGESTNKLLGYLMAVSRKLEEPLSLLIQSRSSAGKSALLDAILAFVPDEDYSKYTRITDQALFYASEKGLTHKILAIEEAAGMGGAAYSIRAMQSSKKLTIAATTKDAATGKLKTEEYEVKGPVGVLLTTTQTDFDPETMSRFLCVTVDESSEMTREIHEAQRQAETIEGILRRRKGERLQTKHHNAQRLIEPMVVANPYAPQLTFSSQRIAARRDHKKYLGLIKAVALLHQRRREVKTVRDEDEVIRYIEVTLEDIAQANAIAAEALGGSNEDVTPQGRQLLGLIRKMLCNGRSHQVGRDGLAVFTRRQVREYTSWSDWQVRTHLGELTELEYLHIRSGQVGKEYIYELGEDSAVLQALPAFGLTDEEELRQALRIA